MSIQVVPKSIALEIRRLRLKFMSAYEMSFMETLINVKTFCSQAVSFLDITEAL